MVMDRDGRPNPFWGAVPLPADDDGDDSVEGDKYGQQGQHISKAPSNLGSTPLSARNNQGL